MKNRTLLETLIEHCQRKIDSTPNLIRLQSAEHLVCRVEGERDAYKDVLNIILENLEE